MRLEYKNSIMEAQRLLATAKDVDHDLSHGRRVAENARIIGKELGYDDLDLLELCGWWHDVGRLYHEVHEVLSAKLMCTDLKTRGVDFKTRRKAYKAVYKHQRDMNPKTLQGRIIKDADKLDFISTERWQKNYIYGNPATNTTRLTRLPKIRKQFYFDITKQLFDYRLGSFAENLEHNGSLAPHALVPA